MNRGASPEGNQILNGEIHVSKRLLAVLFVAAAVLVGGADLNPARAADVEFTVRAGAVPTWPSARFPGNSSGSVTETAFVQRRCDRALLSTPLQGSDAFIVDIEALENKTLKLDWKWDNYTSNRVYVNMYQPDCRLNRSAASDAWSPTPIEAAQHLMLSETGTMYLTVPTRTRWMVVAPEAKKDITFKLSVLPDPAPAPEPTP